MERMLLRGRIIDAVCDKPVEEGAVLIEGEHIAYAGTWSACPDAGAIEHALAENSNAHTAHNDTVLTSTDGNTTRVVDLRGMTILPGFIDVHTHLSGEKNAGDFAYGKLFGDQLVGAVYQAGILLDAGFTSIRDMGYAGLFISRGVERGVVTGPRVMPGGKLLGITSGHLDGYPGLPRDIVERIDHNVALCDGPAECVHAVREQFRLGAQFIKICATGGVSSPIDYVDDVQFSPEELRAIVEEAHRHHSYVTAHCTGNEGAYQALLAGVECIEHGVMLTQREIDLMAEREVPLVSTLYIALGVASMPNLPSWMQEKAKHCAAANLKTIAMAREAGIRIALGTDFSNSHGTPYKHNGREFEAMVRAGLTPMEALRAGTINAAYVMRRANEMGSLEAGKLADIAVVAGNPLDDINVLTDAENVPLVIQGGVIKKDTR